MDKIQIEQVRAVLRKYWGDAGHQTDVPEALCDLAIDGLRYRWLKANHLQTGADSWIRTGDDLEEAIDAAMKE